jgi:hypothetical protein
MSSPQACVYLFPDYVQRPFCQYGNVHPRLFPGDGRERQVDLLESRNCAVTRITVLGAHADVAQED